MAQSCHPKRGPRVKLAGDTQIGGPTAARNLDSDFALQKDSLSENAGWIVNKASGKNARAGKRVLIVEDELMIRMLLEDMLGDLGYEVAGEAAKVQEALEAVNSIDFDLAILDVNLEGEASAAVADALSARGRAFVFATGYSEAGLPEAHRGRPILKKPFQADQLCRVLETAFGGGKD
jgi:CheY-like chemotaxis protein